MSTHCGSGSRWQGATPGEHTLLLAYSHLVVDGWSAGVLVRDLATFYTAHSLNRPPALTPAEERISMRNSNTLYVGSFAALFVIAVSACPTGGGDCVEAMPGTWEGSGSCFDMPMTNTATVDGCEITFADWSMTGEELPSGAVVSGSAATLTGTGWSDCTGTLADSGMSIEGTCPDGCDFTIAMQE